VNKSFKKRSKSPDDENFEEPENQRAIPQFLVNVPGVTATDSMGYRIEALRVYLEKLLGDDPFIAAYKHLVNLADDDDTNDSLDKMLGPKKMKYVPLIHQLIFCEDQYYSAKK
jgi:NIMA (never in mitosis gene a)-related kinase